MPDYQTYPIGSVPAATTYENHVYQQLVTQQVTQVTQVIGGPSHDPATLSTTAALLLSVTGQQLSLDTTKIYGVGEYFIYNAETDPYTVLGYGTWVLDGTVDITSGAPAYLQTETGAALEAETGTELEVESGTAGTITVYFWRRTA